MPDWEQLEFKKKTLKRKEVYNEFGRKVPFLPLQKIPRLRLGSVCDDKYAESRERLVWKEDESKKKITDDFLEYAKKKGYSDDQALNVLHYNQYQLDLCYCDLELYRPLEGMTRKNPRQKTMKKVIEIIRRSVVARKDRDLNTVLEEFPYNTMGELLDFYGNNRLNVRRKTLIDKNRYLKDPKPKFDFYLQNLEIDKCGLSLQEFLMKNHHKNVYNNHNNGNNNNNRKRKSNSEDNDDSVNKKVRKMDSIDTKDNNEKQYINYLIKDNELNEENLRKFMFDSIPYYDNYNIGIQLYLDKIRTKSDFDKMIRYTHRFGAPCYYNNDYEITNNKKLKQKIDDELNNINVCDKWLHKHERILLNAENDFNKITQHTWTNQDVAIFLLAIEKFGLNDWSIISDAVGTKTIAGVKSFYLLFKDEFQLDNIKQKEEKQPIIIENDDSLRICNGHR